MATYPHLYNPYDFPSYNGQYGGFSQFEVGSDDWFDNDNVSRETRYKDLEGLSASRNWLNEYNWSKFMLDYNSEQSKVDRMRSAGLNPDLLGLDSASEASDFQEVESPDFTTAQPDERLAKMQLAQDISGVLMSALGQAQNIVGSIYGTQAQSLANMQSEVDLARSMYDDASYRLGDSGFAVVGGLGEYDPLEFIGGSPVRSRRAQKMYNSIVQQAANGMSSSGYAWDSATGVWKKKHDYAKTLGTIRGISPTGDVTEMVDVYSTIGQFLVDNEKLFAQSTGNKLQAESAQYGYQYDLFSNMSGETAGKATDSQNEALMSNNSLTKEQSDKILELCNSLDSLGKAGRITSALIKVYIFARRNGLVSSPLQALSMFMR